MVIKCETEGKLLAVLAKLSAETDCTWMNGDKVDDYKVKPGRFPVWIIVDRDFKLSWATNASYVPFDNNELTDDEFLKAYGVPTTENDPVNHPAHYTQGKVECIDAMEQVFGRDAVIAFAVLNTWKYLWRRKDKDNEEQDIQKAIRYFDIAKELINR